MRMISRFLHDEQGQDLIEYSLLLALICLGAAAIFITMSTPLNTIWTNASKAVSTGAAGLN